MAQQLAEEHVCLIYHVKWVSFNVKSASGLPMQIVDGIAPVVLNVPAERGEAHAHVEPRQSHATDISSDMGQH